MKLLHHPAIRKRLRRWRPVYDKVFRRKKNYANQPKPVDRLSNMQGRGVFLLCFGRSGSTVFSEFLASHPDVITYGEVLGEDSYYSYFNWLTKGPLRWWALRPSLMQAEFYRFCETLVTRAPGKHCLFDLKIENLHLIEGNWRLPDPYFQIYDHLREAGVPVILLKRRDLVGRHVSVQVAERRGAFHSYHKGATDEIAPFEIDMDAVARQVRAVRAATGLIEEIFAEHPAFDVLTFEDLFETNADGQSRFAGGLSARMAALLQIEDRFDATPQLDRVSGKGYGHVITNWDAVQAYRQEVLESA